MDKEKVVLVDKKDVQLGLMPKLEAHRKGVLHRAFSIFIFNSSRMLLMQKRSSQKYHSPGLWTNTCCSHQRDGEGNLAAGKRRLQEEMGFVTELKEAFSFIYKAPFDNGLTEHELDHVLLGHYNGAPVINKDEVEAYKWMTPEDVKEDMKRQPEIYTAWFRIIFEEFYNFIK